MVTDGEEARRAARLRPAVPETRESPGVGAAEPARAGTGPARVETGPAPVDAAAAPADGASATADDAADSPAEAPAAPAAAEPSPADAPRTIDLDAERTEPRPGGLSRLVRRVPPPRRAVAATAAAYTSFARKPSGRIALPGLLLASLVAITGAAGAYLVSSPGPDRRATDGQVQATQPGAGGETAAAPDAGLTLGPSAEPTVAPSGTAPGDPVALRPADALSTWAQQVSNKIGVPPVAVQAYGYAELVLAQTRSTCRLSWTTLAAIGKVESNHGRSGNASLLTDGRALPAIIGPTLDGTAGNKTIRDTDIGALDGDRVYDHAVGPMQFLPATWRLHAVDGDSDGVRDPNDIDDAALSAAYYLCGTARDLSTGAGWWAAVLAYNNVQAYAQSVFTAANDYGTLSRT